MARRHPSQRPDKPPKVGEKKLPSPNPITNMVIADIVMRGASVMLRQRVEKGLLTGQLAREQATRLVEKRGAMTTLALWGASRIATRSPLGLAVVAGGLAAKVFYDRGKRLEAKRRSKKSRTGES